MLKDLIEGPIDLRNQGEDWELVETVRQAALRLFRGSQATLKIFVFF